MEPCVVICGVVVSRRSDVKRHAQIHDPNARFVFYLWLIFYTRLDVISFFLVARRFTCPWDRCCDDVAHTILIRNPTSKLIIVDSTLMVSWSHIFLFQYGASGYHHSSQLGSHGHFWHRMSLDGYSNGYQTYLGLENNVSPHVDSSTAMNSWNYYM